MFQPNQRILASRISHRGKHVAPILPASSECVLECELFGGSYFQKTIELENQCFIWKRRKSYF